MTPHNRTSVQVRERGPTSHHLRPNRLGRRPLLSHLRRNQFDAVDCTIRRFNYQRAIARLIVITNFINPHSLNPRMLEAAAAAKLIAKIYAAILMAEDINRHRKVAAEFLQNTIENAWEEFFGDYDYDLVKESYDDFEGIPLRRHQAIDFLECVIDELLDSLDSNCGDYCDVVRVALEYDVEDMGEILDGAFTEESMWGRIRYEISRECYWRASDELGEYFDSNFEEPLIEYQDVRTPCE